MTIEQKAKAYDEALKWMRKLYPGLHGATKEDAEHYFPELSESEDERIRKEIINYLDFAESHNLLRAADYEKKKGWLAYLEKQKEQKSTEWKLPEDFEEAVYKVANFISPFDSQEELRKTSHRFAEQLLSLAKKELDKSSEWSEEDELMRTAVIQTLERFGGRGTTGMQIDWLKSLRPQPQKLEDWTEEDERLLGDVLGCITLVKTYKACGYLEDFKTEYTGEELRSFVRSLKSRPRKQPHWKPSEQEKGALRTAIHVLTEERSFPIAAGHLQAILDAFEGKESRKDWKPSEEQMEAMEFVIKDYREDGCITTANYLQEILDQIKKL